LQQEALGHERAADVLGDIGLPWVIPMCRPPRAMRHLPHAGHSLRVPSPSNSRRGLRTRSRGSGLGHRSPLGQVQAHGGHTVARYQSHARGAPAPRQGLPLARTLRPLVRFRALFCRAPARHVTLAECARPHHTLNLCPRVQDDELWPRKWPRVMVNALPERLLVCSSAPARLVRAQSGRLCGRSSVRTSPSSSTSLKARVGVRW
jgi:hypothetical protein